MIALDTETTGVDLHHGAKPYFVTVCHEDGTQQWWEWPVDPLTRLPVVPPEDLAEIRGIVHLTADKLVLQNGKFDVAALASLDPGFGTAWRWGDTHDTLLAGHLLASNQPHDLTSMALHYLGVDIQPYDDKLEEACKEARRIVQQAKLRVKRGKGGTGLYGDTELLAAWRIAEGGLEDMPSLKEKSWKADGWLPKALATELGYPADHPWYTVLRDYANADSAVTLALWMAMEAQLKANNLWSIYRERRKLLPIIYDMERRGVTLSGVRLEEITSAFTADSGQAATTMLSIAKGRSYELELPKGAVNNSLRSFCFDVLDLPRVYNSKARSAAPSLDAKNAIPHWLDVLEGERLEFVRALVTKRARDTALAYMEGYRRFWLPAPSVNGTGDWYVIHPSLNPTGTDTLRMSSSNPNEQNISKKKEANLRRAFGPLPGREWWALDYENLELRIPAYEAGEKDLIDLFERAEEPPFYGSEHLLNFSVVYPDLWEEAVLKAGLEKAGPWIKENWKDTWYQRVKNGDFAVGYGAIDRPDGLGTADRTFGRPGSHARLKARFAKKEALNQHWIRYAERYGYVETLPDKTVDSKRGYPLLCTRTEWGKILPTVPLNYHVQGTACWCAMKAMIRCEAQLQEWRREGFRAYLILNVHDELDFDFPAGGRRNLPKVRRLQKLMEQSGDDVGIPLKVAISWHPNNWGEVGKL